MYPGPVEQQLRQHRQPRHRVRSRWPIAVILTAALTLIAPTAAYAMGFVEADVNVARTHVAVPGDNFGWVGADLGDLDGDGVDADGTPDYIVGAPGFAAVTPTPFGRALVLSGAATRSSTSSAPLFSPGWAPRCRGPATSTATATPI